ncbi:MAG: type II toxin-antitoxin system RelE/ParE family toxin [Myxococcaceae bacterium]
MGTARNDCDSFCVAKEPRSFSEVADPSRSRVAPSTLWQEINPATGFSIRINDQYRICFTFVAGNASGVEIVDYH